MTYFEYFSEKCDPDILATFILMTTIAYNQLEHNDIDGLDVDSEIESIKNFLLSEMDEEFEETICVVGNKLH